jgi:FkbM family methyltransferase
MGNFKYKVRRYNNLFSRVNNWPSYLLQKSFGFRNNEFTFDVEGLRKVHVPRKMMAAFRENFLDDVYFSKIPAQLLSKDELAIVDIGANVGYFSLNTMRKFPNARIFAFEPHPFCFGTMKQYESVFSHFDWNIYQKAVTNEGEELLLNTKSATEYNATSSVFEKPHKKETIRVETIALDEVLTLTGSQTVDFMKIDCEGSEYSILYRAPMNTLERVTSMCIETHKGNLEEETLPVLEAFLQEKGFKTRSLQNDENTGYIWAWKK